MHLLLIKIAWIHKKLDISTICTHQRVYIRTYDSMGIAPNLHCMPAVPIYLSPLTILSISLKVWTGGRSHWIIVHMQLYPYYSKYSAISLYTLRAYNAAMAMLFATGLLIDIVQSLLLATATRLSG